MTGFDRAFPIVNYTGQISKVVIFQRQTLRMLLAIKEAIEEAIDRRRFPRRLSNTEGTIQPHDSGNNIRCILEDVSISGARLRLDSAVILPPFFMLVVPAERIERNCMLAWTNGERAGIRFR